MIFALKDISPYSFPWQELTVISRGRHDTKWQCNKMEEILMAQTWISNPGPLILLTGALPFELSGSSLILNPFDCHTSIFVLECYIKGFKSIGMYVRSP